MGGGIYKVVFCDVQILLCVCANNMFSTFFEDILCTKCSKCPGATVWKRISLYISYTIMFVITLRVFGAPKWKPGRGTFGFLRLLCNKYVFSMLCEDPFCTFLEEDFPIYFI